MYTFYGVIMNFDQILEDCKKRYKPFNKKVEKNRTPQNLEDTIKEKKDKKQNPVITEIKPASPSGIIKKVDKPQEIAQEMIKGGACALSVLTEEKYFNGSLNNLKKVSTISRVPILRKDFIFHKSQIKESYYYGADTLLLIASYFQEDTLEKLIKQSRKYEMEPLVEIHSKNDIDTAKKAGAQIYAINNRDKNTMQIDIKRSKTLSEYIEGTIISASGIDTQEDLNYVLKYCDAALIGTSIMKQDNREEKVRGFVHGN